MTPRNDYQMEMRLHPDEIIVDSFAGGGGASLGISWALGRGPHIAINHDKEAIALHKANHPESEHHPEDVWQIDPVEACAGRKVGLMWLSPDCKHFSKAKGGKPVSKKIRGLAWTACRWAKAVRPRVIVLENVEEFKDWGPLILVDGKWKPDPARKGHTFNRFVARLRRLGYVVEWRMLRASHYATPTIRKRFFLIARCDGRPIVWPMPSHGKGLHAPLSAATIIDWSIPCPSIFSRKKPLAENTQRRIARGIQRYVVDSPNPFIVPMQHANAPASVHAPLQTVTTQGNKFNLVTPIIAGVGGRAGQSPERRLDKPYQTITSKADAAIVAAHVAKHYGGRVGSSLEEPLHTVTAESVHHAVVASSLINMRGTDDSQIGGRSIEEPLPTISGGGIHAAEVRAFLISYYGTEQASGNLHSPAPTLTARDRLGLVTIAGIEYQIVDIGMRMLQPRELYRAQGFPDSYKIAIPFDYVITSKKTGKTRVVRKPLTKTAQVRMAGNSVCPPLAAAIVRANLLGESFAPARARECVA